MAKRVLVADDSITIQKVVELALSDAYEVKCVGNGALAVEEAEKYRPDVILCDALMPEKDGYEVCAFVKGHPELRKIPILVLHGAFESFDEGRARALGANDTLVKPFDTQALLDKVAALLAAPPPPELDAEPAASSEEEEDISRVMSRVDDAFEAFTGPKEEKPADPPAPPPLPPPAPVSEAQLAPETPQERTVAIRAEDVFKMLQGQGGAPAGKADDPGRTAAVTELDKELADMDFGGDEDEFSPAAASAPPPSPAPEPEPEPEKTEEKKKAMPAFDVSASAIISVSDLRDERIFPPPPSQKEEPPQSEMSGEDIPVAYYEPPQGMTDEDKAFAREMMESSSVPMDDVLPEGVKAAPGPPFTPGPPFAAPPPPAPASPVVEEEEMVTPPDVEEEKEEAAMPKEDMNTTELLKDVGTAPVSTAQALLSEKDIEEIVERAVKRVSEKLIREIAWEVVPDLAEVLIRKKIEEIEKGVGKPGN